MYELIKSVSKREVETVIRPAIASAPIDGTRLAVWGATVASDNGHANSQFYLYDKFASKCLKRVVWNGQLAHYELNSLGWLSSRPIKSSTSLAYDEQFHCLDKGYVLGKHAVSLKWDRMCLRHAKVECISNKVKLVLIAQKPCAFNTAFCFEHLWDNRRSVVSDLVKTAKSTYDGTNADYPRFAVLYGKMTSGSGAKTKLFIFDRASAKSLYMRWLLMYDIREVFAVPMASVSRAYTDNPDQIKDTARKYLPTGISCEDFDYDSVELIAVDDDMCGVESVRLYLDI